MNDNDRSIVGFAMLGHALFHTYELSIPVFIVAWLDYFSTTEATLGLVVGVGYALVGVGALPSGVLSDRYGSRRPVVLAVFGMGVGFLALALAPNVVVLAGALVIWGAAASVYHPAALALLSRGTEQRGTAFAYHGAAGNVGTVLGPLAAALLLAFLEWRLVAALFVLPALVGGLSALRLDFDEGAGVEGGHPADASGSGAGTGGSDGDGDGGSRSDLDSDPDLEPETDGGTPADGLRGLSRDARALFSGGFVLVFSIVLLYGLFYRGILTFLPEILGDLPLFDPVTVGSTEFEPSQYVYAGLLTVGVLGQYAGGRLTDATDTVRLLGGTFLALALAALAFVPAANAGMGPLLAVCVALGFLIYFVAPVYQATVADYADSDVHGLSYGFTYLSMFGVGALGAVVAGAVLSFTGTGVLFVVLAAIVVVAAGLCGWLLFGR